MYLLKFMAEIPIKKSEESKYGFTGFSHENR